MRSTHQHADAAQAGKRSLASGNDARVHSPRGRDQHRRCAVQLPAGNRPAHPAARSDFLKFEGALDVLRRHVPVSRHPSRRLSMADGLVALETGAKIR
jgi:hypothetical protein